MADFDKYIEIVDDVLDLSENTDSSLQIIENTKEFYLQNKEMFKKIVPNFEEGKTACGIFVSYGLRLYAATIGEEVELLTHQDGYNDTPIFSYRVDDILDYSTEHDFTVEEESEESLVASSVLLNWSINPQSNIDILPEILSKMVLPSIKRVKKSIAVGNRPVINILLPPFSKDFTSVDNYEGEADETSLDITQILEDSHFEDMELNFLDYSPLVELNGDERKYLAIYHSDGKNEFLVFSVFENIRGHKECLGCIAININTQENFILQIYKQEYEIDKIDSLALENKRDVNSIQFSPVESKLPIPASCSSFLGVHTTSFMDNEYILRSEEKTGNKEIDKIISLFSGTKSMSVAEICARFVGEPNLYNIALGDMVYIAILLDQHDEVFQSSTLKTKRKDRVTPVQNTEFIHYDSNMLPHLPSNFARIGWKLSSVGRLRLVPYQKIGYKLSLRQITESIVNHYDDCTTDDVIDEYLFIHTKNKKIAVHNVPNAISAAKMFIEMINIDSIAINFCNEKVY